jgi:hypothetical protein
VGLCTVLTVLLFYYLQRHILYFLISEQIFSVSL